MTIMVIDEIVRSVRSFEFMALGQMLLVKLEVAPLSVGWSQSRSDEALNFVCLVPTRQLASKGRRPVCLYQPCDANCT